MKLADTTALVTGGGRGLGRVIVQALVAAGARVAFCGRTQETLAETLAGLPADSAAHAVRADVTKTEDVARLVEEVTSRFGPIDVLVNNAGNFHYKPFLDHTAEDWDSSLAINMTASFLTCQAVLPAMLERGSGRIVNIASAYGVHPAGKVVANSASKAGLIGFSKALAAEFKEQGIAINAVCPGSITTKQRPAEGSPVGQELYPQDVADVVVFLAGPGANQICGAAIEVMGKTDPVLKVRGW